MELFRERLQESMLTVCAYCLMPNHIHAVVIPEDENGLARHFRALHSNYAKYVNASHGWKGHLWQERFYSAVMDETHTLCALRYVEMNPVRAGLCDRPEQWRWSSVHANLGDRPDGITDTKTTRKIVPDWRSYLDVPDSARIRDQLRKRTRDGRPAGCDDFVDRLEALTGKDIRQQARHQKGAS
jgi:putative transposase